MIVKPERLFCQPRQLFCQPRQPQRRRTMMRDRPTVTQKSGFSDMTDRLAESPHPYSVGKGKMIELQVPLPDLGGEIQNRVH